MSLLSGNISIRIKDVGLMSWESGYVCVAARPYHALVFRLRGSAEFSCGNLNLSTNAGDVLYMPAYRAYNAAYQDKNEILVIHFESDLNSEIKNYKLNNEHILSLLFHKIYDIWVKKENGYYYSTLALFCEILENISLQQNYLFYNETMKSFEDAVEYMKKMYTSSDFTVEEMVEKAHMSNTYFRKLFFNKFNTTPVKYLTYLRLIYAEKLLSTGKYSINEVAEMSGFGDVKYFCRVVKKEYGVPPSRLFKHM